MKKRILTLSALFALTVGVTYGQQDRLMTHFIYDKMSVNPAATGIDKGICGTMLYRNQWDKVNGAPNSVVFNGEANLEQWLPAGVGVSFYHDAIGFARQNNVVLNYSHHFKFNNGDVFAAGLGVGITNFGMDPQWVPPTQVNDPSLPGAVSGTSLDFNFGLYYKSNRFYAGLSSTHLSQSDINFAPGQGYSTARHFYIMAGYKQPVGTNVLDVQMMTRTDMVKFSLDFNARYIIGGRFYGGLTYRTSDAVAFMAGMRLKESQRFNMWAGYSYDLTLNKLSNISQGTHEMFVRGCYFIPPPPLQKSKHPRWL